MYQTLWIFFCVAVVEAYFDAFIVSIRREGKLCILTDTISVPS